MPYKDPDKRREWDRKRQAKKRRENPEAIQAIKLAYRQRNAEKITKRRREKDAGEREKGVARAELNRAIAKGLLVRGECEIGEDCWGAIDAHHDDYSKPLEIRWLCKSHHMKLHLGLL